MSRNKSSNTPGQPDAVFVKKRPLAPRLGLVLLVYVEVRDKDGRVLAWRWSKVNDIYGEFKSLIARGTLGKNITYPIRKLRMEESSSGWGKTKTATLKDGTGDRTVAYLTKQADIENDSGSQKSIDKIHAYNSQDLLYATATITPVAVPHGSELHIEYKFTMVDDNGHASADGTMSSYILKELAWAYGQDVTETNMECGGLNNGIHRIYYTQGGSFTADGDCIYGGGDAGGDGSSEDAHNWWDALIEKPGLSHNNATWVKIRLIPSDKNEDHYVLEVIDTRTGVDMEDDVYGTMGMYAGE